ncbi:MAG: hypothetical protein KBD64_05435 [Gammaproteobacteria bacterium]|nr:hypothetical protein [Gammaproteobacteria bacterium]
MATRARRESVRAPRIGIFNRLRQFVWDLFERAVGPRAARAWMAQWQVPAPQRTVPQQSTTRSATTGIGFIARLRTFGASIRTLFTRFTRRSASQTTADAVISRVVIPPVATAIPTTPKSIAVKLVPLEEILVNFEIEKEVTVAAPFFPPCDEFYAFACQQGCSVVIFSEKKDNQVYCEAPRDTDRDTEPMFFKEINDKLYKLKLTETAVEQNVSGCAMLAAVSKLDDFLYYELEQDPRYTRTRADQESYKLRG